MVLPIASKPRLHDLQVSSQRTCDEKGWKVTTVVNGQEAFDTWKSGNFDIILMDIQMPEMDGYQSTVAIRLEEEKTGRHIPIIAMTAHTLERDREKCLQAGMDEYISKPIDHKKFEKTLKEWIG